MKHCVSATFGTVRSGLRKLSAGIFMALQDVHPILNPTVIIKFRRGRQSMWAVVLGPWGGSTNRATFRRTETKKQQHSFIPMVQPGFNVHVPDGRGPQLEPAVHGASDNQDLETDWRILPTSAFLKGWLQTGSVDLRIHGASEDYPDRETGMIPCWFPHSSRRKLRIEKSWACQSQILHPLSRKIY
jgi:hypothetical protein